MKTRKILFIISAVVLVVAFALGAAVIAGLFALIPDSPLYIDGSDLTPLVAVMSGAFAFYIAAIIIVAAHISVGIMWGVYGIICIARKR